MKNIKKQKKMRNIVDVIFGDMVTYEQMMKKNLDCKEINAQGLVKSD